MLKTVRPSKSIALRPCPENKSNISIRGNTKLSILKSLASSHLAFIQEALGKYYTIYELKQSKYLQRISAIGTYFMASHESNAVAIDAVPQPNASVTRAGSHVIRVGMELDDIDIRVVTGEDPQGLMMIRRPQTGRPIVTNRREVVAVGREFHVPHRVDVSFVHDEASPRLQTPQPDSAILWTGEQKRSVGAEGDSVDGTSVAVQDFHRLGRFVVHHPDEDVFCFFVDVCQLVGWLHGSQFLRH